jgi:hypothetical protein
MANVTLTYSGNSQNTGNFDIQIQSLTSDLFTKTAGGGSASDSAMNVILSTDSPFNVEADLGLYNNSGSNRMFATGVTRNQLTGGTYTVTGITCGDDAIIVTSKGDVNPQCTGNTVVSLSAVTQTLSTFVVRAQCINGIGSSYTGDTVTSTVYFSGVTGEAAIQHPTQQTVTVTADINDNNAESAPITLYHGTYKFKLIVTPYYPDFNTRPTGKRGDVILTECP